MKTTIIDWKSVKTYGNPDPVWGAPVISFKLKEVENNEEFRKEVNRKFAITISNMVENGMISDITPGLITPNGFIPFNKD